jgi:transketolase C-terminal domain/subunit
MKNDYKIGILLLETLKPYEENINGILDALGKNVRALLFYEEEIMNGGMGTTLSQLIRNQLAERNIKYDILATNDTFAAHSEKGQNAYEMANVDYTVAVERLKNILK